MTTNPIDETNVTPPITIINRLAPGMKKNATDPNPATMGNRFKAQFASRPTRASSGGACRTTGPWGTAGPDSRGDRLTEVVLISEGYSE
jgi:hypothetical protein